MSLRRRLFRLEERQRALPLPPSVWVPQTDEEWLAQYTTWAAHGDFDREPDFPKALAEFEAAIEEARQAAQPRFEPPDGFHADWPLSRRRREWRRRLHFPRLRKARDWLDEFLDRVLAGKPPVTAVEFQELATWFEANDDRLYQRSLPSQVLDLVGDRRTSVGNIRCGVRQGVRASGVTQLIEDLRFLREHYADQPVPPAGGPQ